MIIHKIGPLKNFWLEIGTYYPNIIHSCCLCLISEHCVIPTCWHSARRVAHSCWKDLTLISSLLTTVSWSLVWTTFITAIPVVNFLLLCWSRVLIKPFSQLPFNADDRWQFPLIISTHRNWPALQSTPRKCFKKVLQESTSKTPLSLHQFVPRLLGR